MKANWFKKLALQIVYYDYDLLDLDELSQYLNLIH